MDNLIVARAIHVVGVVLWIGGVAFVTTVLLPGVRRMRNPQERVSFFERIELLLLWIFGADSRARATGGCTPWYSYGLYSL
jgi:uncharacterized membrane protein